jgi:hypothetical protein
MSKQQDYLLPRYKILREKPGKRIWNFRHFLILAITVQYRFYALGLQCLKWSNFSFRNVYNVQFRRPFRGDLVYHQNVNRMLTNSGYLYVSSFSLCRKKCIQYKYKKLSYKMSLIAEMSWPAPAVGTCSESGPCQMPTFPVSFLHMTGFTTKYLYI